MRFTLRNARLVDATTDIPDGSITIDGTLIQAVRDASEDEARGTGGRGETMETTGKSIDAANMIVMPGFIDVHTHGGGGFNLHTPDVNEIRSYARWVPQTGVTSFLAGVVGIPGALPEEQLQAAVQAIESFGHQAPAAELLGIHLEGPYISLHRRGAHSPEWLRKPDPAETERVLELTRGHLRIVTLAPELPGAPAMIRRLVEAGVTVSIGHTDATYEQACEAIQLGATHMTHCFNAMRPLHHRNPGPIAAIVQNAKVRGELIADGVHVHPAIMNVLVKALGPERTIVITDALAAAGIDDPTFEFAGQPAHVICGAAHLADGTLTGSVLTMDRALRNMLTMTEATLPEAVGMLTTNPAQAIHVDNRKGCLQSGYDADLLIFDADLNLQATICCGTLAFATDTWRERLSEL
ncbi:MAG TPA: N-acetylglucosamine-6-phosphate deacetylase [Ktedonobacteraceae bacterium]|nr:N-acetylglucosamine-6-phosphate deacetylase [Ktedonobacteraceae bacterium]